MGRSQGPAAALLQIQAVLRCIPQKFRAEQQTPHLTGGLLQHADSSSWCWQRPSAVVAHDAIALLARRGFTKFSRDDYVQWKREGRFQKDGVNAKVGQIEAHPVWLLHVICSNQTTHSLSLLACACCSAQHGVIQ